MDAEQQEISSMFDCVALSAGLHQHTLFEWGVCVCVCVCVCVTPRLQSFFTNWCTAGFRSLPVQSI